MTNLSFVYRSGSTLRRETFIINVQLSVLRGDDEATFTVIAPNQYFAQDIVRRFLNEDPDVITFWTYAVRAVAKNYRGEVVVHPMMLNGRSVRFPYAQG